MFSPIGQSTFAMEFLIWPLCCLDSSITVLERGRGLGRRHCSKLVFSLVFIGQGCVTIPWVIWTCGRFNYLAGALSLKAGSSVERKYEIYF